MIIRHDDFEFRMEPDEYIENHEKFIKAGLTETAVIQITQHGNIPNFVKNKKIIDYMNTTPNWDIQLHGWSHAKYLEMDERDVFKDVAASIHMIQKLFGRTPLVWYPPHNGKSPVMEKVAGYFGMTIDNESNDIAKFIREKKNGTFNGHSVYFHLWSRTEREMIDEMIELLKWK